MLLSSIMFLPMVPGGGTVGLQMDFSGGGGGVGRGWVGEGVCEKLWLSNTPFF